MIEEALTESLRQINIDIAVEPNSISKKKYKLKFVMVTKDQGGQEQ